MKNVLQQGNRNYNNLINIVGILYIFQLVLSISIVLYYGNYIYNRSLESIKEINYNNHNNILIDINKEVKYLVAEGATISKLASFYKENDIKKLVQGLVDSKPQILRVSFYDKDIKPSWQIVSSAGKELLVSHNIKSIPNGIVRDNIYLEDKKTYVHYVLYPVVNEKNESIGVIELYYDISYLWGIFSNFDAENIYITDRQGKILVKKSNIASDNIIFKKEVFDQYIIKPNEYISYDVNGEKTSGIASQIKTVGWLLIIEDAFDKDSRSATSLLHLINSFAAIVIIINIYIIYYINKKIYKPFKYLNNFSKEFSKENNSVDVIANTNIFVNIIELINKLILTNKLIKNDIDRQIEVKIGQLTKNVKEAESMSSLMVNRELKMIDLKKENLELRNQLKKQIDNNNIKEDIV